MRNYISILFIFCFYLNTLSQSIDYEAQIQPIFTNSCMPCHQGSNPSAGLDLTSYENVMAGSNSGAVIDIGDYENSVLWQEVSSGDMPNNIANNNMGIPDLTDEEVEVIQNWILDLQCILIDCVEWTECILGECVCINDADGDGICDEDEVSLEEILNNKKLVKQVNLLGKEDKSSLQNGIKIRVYDDGSFEKVKHIK